MEKYQFILNYNFIFLRCILNKNLGNKGKKMFDETWKYISAETYASYQEHILIQVVLSEDKKKTLYKKVLSKY